MATPSRNKTKTDCTGPECLSLKSLIKRIKDSEIRSFDDLIYYMYKPSDPASLGVTRFLFGLLMMLDTVEERGGSEADIRWGDPRDCHFPLFPFIRPAPLQSMALVYAALWIGAMGIMLGYKFKASAILYAVPYWYLFLVDKSFWNNHSYLFGLCSLLLIGSSANYYMSIDGLLDKRKKDTHVPYWNYFILKFQFFLLYFYAGLKKTDTEWLQGYSMTRLSMHWVFDPFKLFMTTDQIDFLIIHWFGFIFDLTVGFWLLLELSRPFAMIFCASFHFMNTRLFSIGMFPYVCMATMPLFCSQNWPRKITEVIKKITKCDSSKVSKPQTNELCFYKDASEKKKINWKHKLTVCLLFTHCGVQLFLPYSHSITKGYNNWTNGLYGYSWDMMVHAWDTILVVVKVTDNKTGREHFLDPEAWVSNDRWTKHGDMMVQYVHCLKRNLLEELHIRKLRKQMNAVSFKDEEKIQKDLITDPLINKKESIEDYITSDNISIYVDVWSSLNGHFQQRMFNPTFDLLKVEWSPFKPVVWLMPLLTEFSEWRNKLIDMQRDVYSWSNYSEVMFVADFPGLYLENYIAKDLTNVTLTVLEGEVIFERESIQQNQSTGKKLSKGMSSIVESDEFHKIHVISNTPASYMYTFINQTRQSLGNEAENPYPNFHIKSPFPLIEEIDVTFKNAMQMFKIIGNSVLNILFDVPIPKRVRIY